MRCPFDVHLGAPLFVLYEPQSRLERERLEAVRMGYNLRVSHNVRRSRVVLIDVGASYYNGWHGQGISPDSASSKWFVDMFHIKNIPFDKVFVYERAKLDPARVWESIPADMMAMYASAMCRSSWCVCV
jgi:hypothetical protein